MFEDRKEAGRLLAEKLLGFKDKALVIGIPRGGVLVAKVVAQKLQIPLATLVTKKIGAPDNEELAIGAIGPKNTLWLDEKLIADLQISHPDLEKQIEKAKNKVKDYQAKFGNEIKPRDERVILVDDGIATGATLRVAIDYLRQNKAKEIVLAVPIAPLPVVKEFESLVDQLIVLATPANFRAVGQFYRDFPQVSDTEVLKILNS